MAQRIAGTAYWFYDGKRLAVRGGLTVSPSPTTREGIAGQDSVHGFSENPRVPFIEGDVSMVDETDLTDIEAVTSGTITAELANGKVYVLRDAWCRSAHEINSKDGQVRVRFEGMSCIQLNAA